MAAAKSANNKDTYKATALSFIVIGALMLFDKIFSFRSLGLEWIMQKDNFLLYAGAIFLLFKKDKSIGLILLGLWLMMNIGLVISLLGAVSGYLLPLTLLLVGGILYFVSTR